METPNERKYLKKIDSNLNNNQENLFNTITPNTFNSISFLNNSNSFNKYDNKNLFSITPMNKDLNKENLCNFHPITKIIFDSERKDQYANYKLIFSNKNTDKNANNHSIIKNKIFPKKNSSLDFNNENYQTKDCSRNLEDNFTSVYIKNNQVEIDHNDNNKLKDYGLKLNISPKLKRSSNKKNEFFERSFITHESNSCEENSIVKTQAHTNLLSNTDITEKNLRNIKVFGNSFSSQSKGDSISLNYLNSNAKFLSNKRKNDFRLVSNFKSPSEFENNFYFQNNSKIFSYCQDFSDRQDTSPKFDSSNFIRESLDYPFTEVKFNLNNKLGNFSNFSIPSPFNLNSNNLKKSISKSIIKPKTIKAKNIKLNLLNLLDGIDDEKKFEGPQEKENRYINLTQNHNKILLESKEKIYFKTIEFKQQMFKNIDQKEKEVNQDLEKSFSIQKKITRNNYLCYNRNNLNNNHSFKDVTNCDDEFENIFNHKKKIIFDSDKHKYLHKMNDKEDIDSLNFNKKKMKNNITDVNNILKKINEENKNLELDDMLNYIFENKITKDNKINQYLSMKNEEGKIENSNESKRHSNNRKSCTCKKTNCSKYYCLCLKNGLKCDIYCSCNGCSNKCHEKKDFS